MNCARSALITLGAAVAVSLGFAFSAVAAADWNGYVRMVAEKAGSGAETGRVDKVVKEDNGK